MNDEKESTWRAIAALSTLAAVVLGAVILLVWLVTGAFTAAGNPVLIRVAGGAVRLTGWGWLLLLWLCVVVV